MKKFFQEFKTFAMRGNVVDMAVGIILGGAFGKIVSSLVSDIIMPPIGLILGGVDFTDLKITIKEAALNATTGAMDAAVTINYGQFIQIIIDFLIVAFAIFLMIKGLNKLSQKKKEEEAVAPALPPEPSKEETLLTEIRDLLKEKK
ncbi:large-conductance mechanosensitive channel protein MscL [Bacteroidales bacterium OttesenSCG-928-C19]|nr:large-conductance mechanosensitive channel protein MscL [Bacteroidales bacterium OttesenSCG-928-C19]